MAAKKSSGRKYGRKASKKVARAMHERKRGTLKSGSGRKVTSRKQAIAIGLSEAREEGAKVPPARKSSRKKSSSRKSTAKKGSSRKKSTAKKSSTRKKSTAKKSSTRKQSAAKRSSSRKKTSSRKRA